MELRQLRYLRAVVRTGSVTAGAEAEFVSQPSVSKQLRLLERELGAPLFHRVGRRVIPTEAALTLADAADRVFDELARAREAIAGAGASDGGSLAMCATETVTDNLLPPALAELRRRRPRCHIRVEMLGSDDAIARVLADEFDLALVVLPVTDSRLEVEPLLAEDVLLAVPPGHAWAGRDPVSLAEALAEPGLLLSMPGLGLRAMVDEAAREVGVTLEARLELRSQQAILALVASGGGVAFSPRMSVQHRGDVAAVRTEPPLRREIGWVRRRGRHLPAVAFELLELLAN